MRERLYYFNLNPSVTISHSRDIKVPLVLWEFDKVWRRCNIKRQKSLTVFLSCFLRKCGVIAVLIFSKWIAYSVTGMETFCYDEMTVFLGGEDFQLTRQWQALSPSISPVINSWVIHFSINTTNGCLYTIQYVRVYREHKISDSPSISHSPACLIYTIMLLISSLWPW